MFGLVVGGVVTTDVIVRTGGVDSIEDAGGLLGVGGLCRCWAYSGGGRADGLGGRDGVVDSTASGVSCHSCAGSEEALLMGVGGVSLKTGHRRGVGCRSRGLEGHGVPCVLERGSGAGKAAAVEHFTLETH